MGGSTDRDIPSSTPEGRSVDLPRDARRWRTALKNALVTLLGGFLVVVGFLFYGLGWLIFAPGRYFPRLFRLCLERLGILRLARRYAAARSSLWIAWGRCGICARMAARRPTERPISGRWVWFPDRLCKRCRYHIQDDSDRSNFDMWIVEDFWYSVTVIALLFLFLWWIWQKGFETLVVVVGVLFFVFFGELILLLLFDEGLERLGVLRLVRWSWLETRLWLRRGLGRCLCCGRVDQYPELDGESRRRAELTLGIRKGEICKTCTLLVRIGQNRHSGQ